MAAISVRDLDEETKDRLRRRAARNGRSMEAEVRAILSEAVRDPIADQGLGMALLTEFGALGGVELDEPDRSSTTPRAADLAFPPAQ